MLVLTWTTLLVLSIVVIAVPSLEQQHEADQVKNVGSSNNMVVSLVEKEEDGELVSALPCHQQSLPGACGNEAQVSLGFACADEMTCEDCYALSSLCHWCAFDEACHMRGSVHGCVYGESCNQTDTPTAAPTATLTPTLVPTSTSPTRPKLKHCVQHTTCEDCTRTEYCHWCARDKRCHVMGSVSGCWYGVNCNSNERCQRQEPQPLKEVGLTEPEEIIDGVAWERQLVAIIASVAGVSVGILLALVTLLLCGVTFCCRCAAAAAAAICRRGTRQDASAAPAAAGGERQSANEATALETCTTQDADNRDHDSLRRPLLEQEQEPQQPKPKSSWWSTLASVLSSTSRTSATSTGDEAEAPSSRKERVGDSSVVQDDDEERQIDREDIPTATVSLGETSALLPVARATATLEASNGLNDDGANAGTRPSSQPLSLEVVNDNDGSEEREEREESDDSQEQQGRIRKRRRCCCVCCSCSSIILTVAALTALAVAWLCFWVYPIWPQYSVCSDEVAWKSILEAMKQGHEKATFEILASIANPNVWTAEVSFVTGLLTHNSSSFPPTTDVVGSFQVVTNGTAFTTIEAHTITDVVVAVTVSPARTMDLWNLMEEFYKGTLVLGLAETHGTVRVPRWQYWIDLAGKYIPPATPWVDWLQDISYNDMLIPVNRSCITDRHLCACPEW